MRQRNILQPSVREWFREFRKRDPRDGDLFEIEQPEKIMALAMGELHGVIYAPPEQSDPYQHLFSSKDRPLLLVSTDGSQLLIAQGRYRVTSRGIVG